MQPTGKITIIRAKSRAEARSLLLAAKPPNESFTQLRNFSAEQIDRALRLGFRKPRWVWAARDTEGAVLGVVAGWGSKARETPFIIDFLDLPLDSPMVAGKLLERAVLDSAEPGRATLEIIFFLPTDQPLEDPRVAAFVELLADNGFRLLVRRRRFRLEVLGATTTIPETGLLFDSLERADDPRLPTVLEEILVGSLDAHDVDALNRDDLATVARDTANEYLEIDPVESMFLAIDPTIPDSENQVVGLVIGGLRGTAENGTASFIGVSHRHRGRGYAAQLLGWITKRMIGQGALFIIGETDDGNFPMAAAFSKVGYPHTESRIDFVRDLPLARRVGGSE
ncbi:MAG TPA: GNAT family N-acetyltransferase [Galbitalea sp.]|jgi:GNAT superfamily N-acetyltransferase|nr:GNAT family N-acetyltransferase [Galbitalea sp.]